MVDLKRVRKICGERDLRKGTSILLLSGLMALVDSVAVIDSIVPVYNFEVAETHDYFVGTEGVLVHNSCEVPDLVALIPNSLKQLSMCREFANKLKTLMQNQHLSGELIKVQTPTTKGMNANIWSDIHGVNISTNGYHEAIKVGNTVYDNMNPNGMDFTAWRNDLFSPSGRSISGTPF